MTRAEARPRTRPLASAFDAALALLLAHDRFVLTTHRDPDGDGLGAEAALAAALRQLGKDCRIVNDSALPAGMRESADAGGDLSSRRALDPRAGRRADSDDG